MKQCKLIFAVLFIISSISTSVYAADSKNSWMYFGDKSEIVKEEKNKDSDESSDSTKSNVQQDTDTTNTGNDKADDQKTEQKSSSWWPF